MKLIRVKEITSTVQSSYASTYILKHLKSKSEMLWRKILQPNASTVKITKVT